MAGLLHPYPVLVQDLASVPGVKLVSPQKIARIILVDGEHAFLYAFDHRLLRQYSAPVLEQGTWPAVAGLGLQALFVGSAEFLNRIAIDLKFPWVPVATAVAVAVLLAPLAGLLPARWAARMDVVEALRYE